MIIFIGENDDTDNILENFGVWWVFVKPLKQFQQHQPNFLTDIINKQLTVLSNINCEWMDSDKEDKGYVNECEHNCYYLWKLSKQLPNKWNW